MSHLAQAIDDGLTGTWVWYGRKRFASWTGWLRPWNWVKFKRLKSRRDPEPYAWRLVLGPLELRRVRGTMTA